MKCFWGLQSHRLEELNDPNCRSNPIHLSHGHYLYPFSRRWLEEKKYMYHIDWIYFNFIIWNLKWFLSAVWQSYHISQNNLLSPFPDNYFISYSEIQILNTYSMDDLTENRHPQGNVHISFLFPMLFSLPLELISFYSAYKFQHNTELFWFSPRM